MKLKNDLGYDKFSNPNRTLTLVLMHVGNHQNSLKKFTTLAKDFIASHSLSQHPQIPMANNPLRGLDVVSNM